MPRRYRPREVMRILTSQGWEFDHYTGSHANFRKRGYSSVTVPDHRREVTKSTLSSILRQMGVTRAEFDRIADEVL